MGSDDIWQKIKNLMKNIVGAIIVLCGIIVAVLGYLSVPYLPSSPETSNPMAYRSFPGTAAALLFLGGFVIIAGFLVNSRFSGEKSRKEWISVVLVCTTIMLIVSAIVLYIVVDVTWTQVSTTIPIGGGRGIEGIRLTPSVSHVYEYYTALLGVMAIVLIFTALYIKSRIQ